jgi:hypothetical protein
MMMIKFRMQTIILLTVLAVIFGCTLSLDVVLNQNWKLWKEANNKHYSNAEEHVRFVFLDRIS